ncbi:MAG: aminotransferase class V-fold PLP-dependent enzyme, partial [Acidobacteriota bacterium]
MHGEDATSRRRFLKAAGVGVTALALELKAAREAFAEDLARVAAAGGDGPFVDLRRHYGLADGLTYVNHASIGTIPRAVRSAHRRYLDVCESNPWLHMWGDAWIEPLADVRGRAAGLLGCDADEVSFSHNTTEVFNLLAHGLPLGDGDEVLWSSLNHSGASVCWTHVGERRGYTVRRFDFPVHDA